MVGYFYNFRSKCVRNMHIIFILFTKKTIHNKQVSCCAKNARYVHIAHGDRFK